MEKQVHGVDACGGGGRVSLELDGQSSGHGVQQVLEDHAPGPGGGRAVGAQGVFPGVPGLAGPTVPLQTLGPGGSWEAQVAQDLAGHVGHVAHMVDGLPGHGEVESPAAAGPGTTLE